MMKTHVIATFVCLGIAASSAAGDLWVICANGLEIFLDGESAGACDAAENGTRVPGLETGAHTIQVRREGFASAEFPFTVGPASAQILVPEVEGDPSGSTEGSEDQKLGAIQITSNPRACKIGSAGRAIEKHQPILTFVGVPFGKHGLQFKLGEQALMAHVPVHSHVPVQVRVDFSSNQVVITADSIKMPESEPATEEKAPGEEPECVDYWAQVMRFSNEEELEPVQKMLKEMGFPEYHQRVVTIEDDGVLPLYKLYVGPIERVEKAKWVRGLLRNAGFKSVIIVTEKCVPKQRLKRRFKPIR